MAKTQTKKTEAPSRMGDYIYKPMGFANVDKEFAQFKSKEFKTKSARKRFQQVNESLLKLIQEAPHESFLLPAVIDYIDRINREGVLSERFHFSLFEFWLNLFSNLKDHENYEVRGKIAGKYIPRDDYQAFFPIGMDKVFGGSHFVCAHLSPDVDTMVASFWGWVDAFAARVSNAQHLWSLPGGPPSSPVTQTFCNLFGSSVFSNTAHMSGALTLKALDFVTQKGFVKQNGTTSISSLDVAAAEKGVVLVDNDGNYIGDWHNSDADPVRKIIIRFKSCLRWFENNLHVKLISFFAKSNLHVNDIEPMLASVFDVSIDACEPIKEFTDRQRKDLDDFFHKVLGIKNGLKGTFGELSNALDRLSIPQLEHFRKELESLRLSDLFDKSGKLIEDRPAIFNRLEKIIQKLDTVIHHIRDYAERLDIAMSIKMNVLGIPARYTTFRSDVEDLRIKMTKADYLTVVISEDNGKLFPIGIVWANELNKQTLGTVSFRDFCNQEEVKMASYLTPISVIDHHKASLKTSSAPNALIGDAQSCNIIVAEQAFAINDMYSLGGMTPEAIDSQMERLHAAESTFAGRRLLHRLSSRHIAVESRERYFIHPDRELLEYLCFLYAILDDTDLLTKVSKRDVDCIVQLLNRVQSILAKEEVEVINLDDIPRDKSFATVAAKRIIQNSDMYSIYKKLYETRESEIESDLELKNSEHWTHLFLDTKEQNGCCRVGQTKLFSINFPTFLKKESRLMEYWLKTAQNVNANHPEIDLHLHMISTIPSATEVYEDRVGRYTHQDELWFWVAPTTRGLDHLTSFLTAFQSSSKFGTTASLEILPGVPEEIVQIFNRDFGSIPRKKGESGLTLPVVIFRFDAGTLNSRKAKITPYLPRLVP